MNDQEPSKPADTDLGEQARAWFVQMLRNPSAAERAECEAWRRADFSHEEAYRKVEAAWNVSMKPGERVAAREADKLAVYLEAMDRAKAQTGMRRRLSAASIMLALLLGGAIWLERPHLLQNMMADHATGRGEVRMVMLSDGSTALLDADSAISEDIGSDRRRVTLIRGAAFFDVAKTGSPFVVDAGSGKVTVLGTRFDVRLLDEGGAVTLESGKVSVGVDEISDQVTLAPGQQVRFDGSGIGEVQDVEPGDALAWREGRFVFYRARLADVVREIERYRPGRIVIVGAPLADELVTGSFVLADTDAALQSLQDSVGFRMSSVAGRLTVIRP
jgi:transmembrane sensor